MMPNGSRIPDIAIAGWLAKAPTPAMGGSWPLWVESPFVIHVPGPHAGMAQTASRTQDRAGTMANYYAYRPPSHGPAHRGDPAAHILLISHSLLNSDRKRSSFAMIIAPGGSS